MKLTNYYEHKGDSRYMVYEFYVDERADHFEKLLIERRVEYERFFDEDASPPVVLFGVNKRFQTQGNESNFLTHAHFRSPMIRNKFARYALLIITIGMVALALYGYFVTR